MNPYYMGKYDILTKIIETPEQLIDEIDLENES
jgi:hypothetical protein